MWSTKTREDVELLELFEQSGRNVQKASALLRDLFSDYPERPELATEVLACEHEGDRIAHEILSRLAERGAADLDAADVHALAGALDDIVDHAEEAADQLGLYRVEAPMEQAQQMAEILVGTADLVADSLRGLRDGEAVAQQLVEIHRCENEADTLESAVDACETVANVLEGITLKRAANGRH
jgi:uncharacterized protein Yka (UPF0111/DUF47 family)